MLLATVVAVVGAPAARAATFVVDSTADTGDANAGNGACADAGGDCTLRAAVEEANALPGADGITLPAGTYVTASPLSVASDVMLRGAGRAATRLYTTDSDYVLRVEAANRTVEVEGLTVGPGAVATPGNGLRVDRDGVTLAVTDVMFDGLDGEGIIVCCDPGGGDPDDVTVTVADSTFRGNGYSVLFAGGTNPVLELADSLVEDNGYALLFDGAGGGSMDLLRSEVTGTDGGGIEFYAVGATLRVHDSDIHDNLDWQGIYGSDKTQTVEVLRSVIANNAYQGLWVYGDVTIRDTLVSGNGNDGIDQSGGTLLVEDSTFTGNSGYGLAAYGGPGASATIRNTTMVANGSSGHYALFVGDYDTATVQNVTATGSTHGLGMYAGSYTIRNTIIADSATADCDQPYTSAGGNLTSDASCGFGATSDVVAAAKLGALADNGGPTPTRMPASDSPAVDAAIATGCPSTDQRGVSRPRDGDGDAVATCDVGAVERGGAEAGTADLRLTKQADRDEAAIGQLVTYTLTVRNDGPDSALQARITDPLPAGMVFSSSPEGCVELGAAVTCELGSLAPGASATRHVVVSVTDDGTHTNTATVSSAASDPTPGNDSASASVTGTAPDGVTDRIFGVSRVETAVAASQDTYGDGGAGAVVLARADTFPDALAGAPLAVANRAPLLLTETAGLHAATAAELERVLPPGGTVHLLGGLAALSQAVEDAVAALGYDVVRYPGADRYATAVLISQALGEPGAIFVATGRNFPDALAAGAAAAELGGVIVLTDDDSMVGSTADYIAEHADVDRYAIGGPSAGADPQATPVVGADRYATALRVATTFFDEPAVVGVAVGTNFPDALAGDTHIARRRAPMLLVDRGVLPGSVADYLAANRASIRQVFVYGGEVAISADVEAAIAAALD